MSMMTGQTSSRSSASFHAGGMAACSRWSSEAWRAIPPDNDYNKIEPRRGSSHGAIGHIILRAEEISRLAAVSLARAGEGRVHSVFRRCFNITLANGSWLTVAVAPFPQTPDAIITEARAGYPFDGGVWGRANRPGEPFPVSATAQPEASPYLKKRKGARA